MWAEDLYAGFNDTHLTEILAEREHICIGRETLRGILRAAGHRPKRRRRPKRHHRRRERSASKGLMVLWDGSPHRWFGDQEPAATLMAAVDDADGELLAAFFVPQETSAAYLKDRWIRRYNRRFRKVPRSQRSAYRARRGFDLERGSAASRFADRLLAPFCTVP